MGKVSNLHSINDCSSGYILAMNDTLNVIDGKWKMAILVVLFFGKKRYSEIEREIPNINSRMLSKELRDLEANGIVIRTVNATVPVTVEYELTESGQAFRKVLDVMLDWGLEHRRTSLEKK